MRLPVPERGSTKVPKDIWPRLAAEPSLWTLVRDKVLSIESHGPDQMLLKGSCYVGRAVVGGVTLELTEKFPGAFRALCTASLPDNTKLAKVPSAAGNSPLTTALLVKVFIDAVETYVAKGREFAYMKRRERGSLIGGTLNLAETIRLRARGIRYQVAFSRTVITTVTDFNLVLSAALLRVETLSRSQLVDRDSVIAARALNMVFAECQEAVVHLTPSLLRELAVQQADMRQEQSGIEGHLAELAAAILGEAGFGEEGILGGLVRRSWFVNLENMFERAIRNHFASILNGRALVTSAAKAPNVFVDLTGRYPANTDVVIRSGDVICIGDAKYKDRRPREWPNADEIQELLTHASAYKASKAFLMFPAEERWEMRVGSDRSGCEVWCFGVRLENMAKDVAAATAALGYTFHQEEAA